MRLRQLIQHLSHLVVLWWLSLLLMVPATVRAERLPMKIYTTADGLAQDSINRIVRDWRGFLWFCTEDGLSRYNGYTFTNYGIEQGLPNRRIMDLLETREGEYWVATGGGLCRFNPGGEPVNRLMLAPNSSQIGTNNPMFTIFYPGEDDRSRFVTRLLPDRSGAIWCGTQRGLFRLERAGRHVTLLPVDIGLPKDSSEGGLINALCEDRRGTLWIGGASGLYRRWPDGRAARYTQRDGLPDNGIHTLLEDHRGDLWVGTRNGGFFQLISRSDAGEPQVARRYAVKDGLSSNWIFDLFESSDGRFWIATNEGLSEFFPSNPKHGPLFRAYPRIKGIGNYEILSLAEDQYGNLWMGTNSTGAMKLASGGFTTYGEGDGFISISSIFENTGGELCFVGGLAGDVSGRVVSRGARTGDTDSALVRYWRRLGRFDGHRFTWLRPNLPDKIESFFGWGWNQIAVQDHTGEWWIMTWDGLYRFPRVSRFEQLQTVHPKAVYTTKDGLASPDLFRVFEDSRGDIWISTISSIQCGLARWERATKTLRDMSRSEGLPSLKDRTPISFREDRAGNLWMGFSWGGLARYRDGRFTYFTANDGIPAGWIYDLFTDHAGRLWIASTLGGLARLDDPGAARPSFTTYTTAHGLSSNKILCITEDRYGRLYVGTARGLDRLDPVTGRVKHFTSADGLIAGEIPVVFCDRKGEIWIGGAAGLSRLIPRPDRPASPPPILINGVRIAGVRWTISALGETAISLPDLTPGQNQLQIDFVGLSFASGESLRYQYKLEQADRDWSALTDQRTVNYANLAPGRYRFLVRAVNSDGVASSHLATVAFTILRPLWQRWWFLVGLMLGSGLLGYAFYRYRIARLLEIERVRTRIAADLHDDIGSNLSRIALLSEVIRQQMPKDDPQMTERLSLISSVSRESVDAMSDIVWAINPKRDRLRDLIQRMRRFAEDAFQSRSIEFQFHAPGAEQDIKLGVDTRREVFLIFKESINNLVRHSACTEAEIDFQIQGGWLVLKISDNGKGFTPDSASLGHGLISMRQRAKKLDGELELRSTNGQGTSVRLRVPVK